MKTIVIKWWRVAALSVALVANAPAAGADQWQATVVGGDLRFDPIRLELKSVPATNLVVRPDATIRKLIERAGTSIGRPDHGPAVSPSLAGAADAGDRITAAPVAAGLTNRTVPVICVSGCEGLFRADRGQPRSDAS